MAFIPVPGVINVQLVFSVDGQIVENVLNFDVPDSSMLETATELCENLVGWFTDNMQALLPVNVSLNRIVATDMSSSSGYSLVYTAGLPLVGGDAVAHILPNNVSLAVKLAGSGRGRSSRGRVFQVGLVQEYVNGNTVASAYITLLKEAYEALMSIPMTAGSAQLVVVSKFVNKIARSVGLISPVVSVAIDAVIDSQRRRLPGRGR